MVEVYTKEEVDKIAQAIQALIPSPMPDEVKGALRVVLEWLIGTL